VSETHVTKQMRKRIIRNRMHKSVLDRIEHRKVLRNKKIVKELKGDGVFRLQNTYDLMLNS